MITVYPIGTTIYDPEKAFGGYTLLNFLHEPDIVLFDMNGRVVNTWRVERGPEEPAPGSAPLPPHPGPRDDPPGAGAPWSGIWNYAHLLENGNMLGPREYDWDDNLVWEPPYVPGYTAGLSRRLDNGNTLYSSRREMPEEHKARVNDPARRHLPVGRPVAGRTPGALHLRDDARRRGGLGVGLVGARRRQPLPGDRSVAELDALQPPRSAA